MIKVGAATESEMKEKKARLEDALHATRAAVEAGIVPRANAAGEDDGWLLAHVYDVSTCRQRSQARSAALTWTPSADHLTR